MSVPNRVSPVPAKPVTTPSGPAVSRSAAAIRASVFTDLAPRIEERRRRGADLVELHVGDTCLAPPEGARFAKLDERQEGGPALYTYASVHGLADLRRAFVERLVAAGCGPEAPDPEREVLVGCGATHALFCALRAVLEPGDEVLLAAPYWPLAAGIVRAVGGVPVEVPLTGKLRGDPTCDVAKELESKRTGRTRAVYFISPNNPDGTVYTRPQLQSLTRFALAHDLWVIADEVYADYVYDGEHVSVARLDRMRERTISVYSVSKSHALAGARIGFAVAPEAVVALARRIAMHTVFHPPVAAQRVSLAALTSKARWIDQARAEYRQARDAAMAALDGWGPAAQAPQGGVYAFVDFAPLLGARPLGVLLEAAVDRGVILAPGDAFGEAFATSARVCFTAAPLPRVLEGIARLRAAAADLAST